MADMIAVVVTSLAVKEVFAGAGNIQNLRKMRAFIVTTISYAYPGFMSNFQSKYHGCRARCAWSGAK
jgi:hypothetical protein